MLYVKDRLTNEFVVFDTSVDIKNYINEAQCSAIIDARNKVDKLLFTSNYYVNFFDVYVSEYACFIVFEVKNTYSNVYLNTMRGQWFIDEIGRLYVRDNNEKEYITESVYIFTAKVQGGND